MWLVVHYHVADVKDHSPPKGLPVAPVYDYKPWDDDKYKDIQDPEIMEERERKHDHTKTDDGGYYGGGKVKGDGTEPMDGVGDDAIRNMELNGVAGDTDKKGAVDPDTDPEEEDDDAATDDANERNPGEDAEEDEEANVGESEDDAEEEDRGDDDGEK